HRRHRRRRVRRPGAFQHRGGADDRDHQGVAGAAVLHAPAVQLAPDAALRRDRVLLARHHDRAHDERRREPRLVRCRRARVSMRTTTGVAIVALSLVAARGAVAGPSVTGARERGRYLVEQVAMCGECHTPRRHDGTLDRDLWLDGAPVPVQPPPFGAAWAIQAPRIAGLAAYSDEQAI